MIHARVFLAVVSAGLFALPTLTVIAQAATATVELEVTQGIQYVGHPVHGTNSIPLVAGRTTVVRTRVTIAGAPAGASVKNVKGELTVTAAAGTPAAPSAPQVFGPLNKNRFRKAIGDLLSGAATFGRENADHTLNFEVTSLEAGDWDFVVEIEITFQDGSSVKGQGRATLESVATRPVAIRLVPLRFTAANNEVFGPPAAAQLGEAEWLVRGCYPLPDDTDIRWKRRQNLPTTDRPCVRMIGDKESASDGKSDVEEVLEALKAMWVSTTESGAIPPDSYYYGFVEPADPSEFAHSLIGDSNCMMVYGWGLCPGPVGFGTARWDIAAKTFAHELGHSFDLQHCGICGPDSCDLDGQVGWDAYGGLGWTAPQADSMSFMTCGVPAKKVWITPENYKKCIEVLKVGSTVATLSGSGHVADAPVQRALVVQGAFTDDGMNVAWLGPMFRYPWGVPPDPATSEGPFAIEAASADRSVVVTRRCEGTIRVEYPNGQVAVKNGFFSVVVPFPPETEVETVTIRRETTVLRTVRRSRSPPQIQIVSPGRDTVVNRPTPIRWTLEDTDTERSGLRCHVLYSPDGGESFDPVQVNLVDTELVFEPAYVSASQNGLIRVLANDGLNTSFADVGMLRVSPK
ncbi:MAG: hypothetical protein JXA90_15245 [Planctomycetes bacterium]|nr:hypothetical protein [Planctomycetota bacterium]